MSDATILEIVKTIAMLVLAFLAYLGKQSSNRAENASNVNTGRLATLQASNLSQDGKIADLGSSVDTIKDATNGMHEKLVAQAKDAGYAAGLADGKKASP